MLREQSYQMLCKSPNAPSRNGQYFTREFYIVVIQQLADAERDCGLI